MKVIERGAPPPEVAAPAPNNSPRQRPNRRVENFVDRHVVRVFVGPAVLFILLAMAFPVVYTIYLSFHQWFGSLNSPPEFVGIENFRRLLLEDGRFWAAVGRTMLFTSVAVATQTVLGVALAVLLHREFRLRGLMRSVMLLPMIATPVAIAMVWRLMYQPELGIINEILTTVGLPPANWLSDSKLALLALMVVDTWEWTPLIGLITLAGLSALPEEPLEAALVDGASTWQRFWHVVLPMVRPVVVVAVVFRLIEALKTFDIILVMTQGGPGFATETLNIYVYNTAFQYQQLGYAAAILILFFLIVSGSAGALLRLRRPGT
jgi:multiple sugar transport system permease protein